MSNKQKNVLKYSGSIIETRKILKANYHINPIKISQIKSGIINTSFVINCGDNKYVFRVYQLNNRSLSNIKKELLLCEKLNDAGLPIPLVYIDCKNNKITNFRFGNKLWHAALFEHLPGRHLKHTDKSLVGDVSKIHARMHLLLQNQISNQANNFVPQLIRLINSESVISNEKLKVKNKSVIFDKLHIIKRQVIDELKNNKQLIATLPNGYCHLDYDSSNILTDSKIVSGIIDFDDMVIAPFIADISFSLWWWLFFNRFDQKIFNSYLKSYSTVRNLSENEFKYVFLFLRARNIFLAYILFVNQAKVKTSNLNKALQFDEWIKNKYEKHPLS